MKKATAVTILSLTALLLGGCSTYYCGTQQTIPIKSRPGGAQVTIYNIYNEAVFKGVTPCEVTLDRKSPADVNARYRVTIIAEGYEPVQLDLNGKVNGAYFGNFLNGVGFIIDPIVGSMWTLSPESIDTPLAAKSYAAFEKKDGIFVALKEELPKELLPYLQPVQN